MLLSNYENRFAHPSYLSLDCGTAHALAQKELKEIDQDQTSGVTVQLVSGSLSRLTGFVQGALS